MIDTTRLHPPGSGLSTNPILFGISEGLARLLPLPEDDAFAARWPLAAGEEPAPAAAPVLAEVSDAG
ncbi:hypothetical protein MPPM_4986 [Methylorubrum populi]|uniref:Uncharacterized protein n=1 Tax=Methylorubrum populi TaxID=223967 RepID=A0A160PMD0_9HYPH|nr:hypothetical protein [Methylorubrum populi]BAU93591.1 hypothetical protein MPPM_4986 [Methylorubrum populi]